MFAFLPRIAQLAQFGSEPSDEEAAVILGIGIVVILVILLVSLAIGVFIAYVIYAAQNRVPREHQKLEPALVWLLVVPVLQIVWIFMVAIKVPESLKSYFDAQEDATVGDCGRGVGLGWAICTIVSWIPFLGFITGLAALICMILFLVKVNELKNRIPLAEAA